MTTTFPSVLQESTQDWKRMTLSASGWLTWALRVIRPLGYQRPAGCQQRSTNCGLSPEDKSAIDSNTLDTSTSSSEKPGMHVAVRMVLLKGDTGSTVSPQVYKLQNGDWYTASENIFVRGSSHVHCSKLALNAHFRTLTDKEIDQLFPFSIPHRRMSVTTGSPPPPLPSRSCLHVYSYARHHPMIGCSSQESLLIFKLWLERCATDGC